MPTHRYESGVRKRIGDFALVQSEMPCEFVLTTTPELIDRLDSRERIDEHHSADHYAYEQDCCVAKAANLKFVDRQERGLAPEH